MSLDTKGYRKVWLKNSAMTWRQAMERWAFCLPVDNELLETHELRSNFKMAVRSP